MAWNQSTGEAAKPQPKKPSALRGVIAGVVCAVIAAAVAIFVLSGKDEKPKAKVEKEQGFIKEVKPAAAPVAKETAPSEVEEKKQKADKFAALRKMTPEEKQQYRLDYLKSRPPDLTPMTNRPFRTGTELQMARIFTTELGDPPPPLFPIPIQDEIHLAKILITANPTVEGDSEKVVDAKAMVEAAKKEMREYIKDGGDPQDFLTYYHGKLMEAYQQKQMYAQEVVRVAREDPSIARAFYDEVNEKLKAKGIKPIKLSKKLKEIMEREQ